MKQEEDPITLPALKEFYNRIVNANDAYNSYLDGYEGRISNLKDQRHPAVETKQEAIPSSGLIDNLFYQLEKFELNNDKLLSYNKTLESLIG